jgi:hypothetical protein
MRVSPFHKGYKRKNKLLSDQFGSQIPSANQVCLNPHERLVSTKERQQSLMCHSNIWSSLSVNIVAKE